MCHKLNRTEQTEEMRKNVRGQRKSYKWKELGGDQEEEKKSKRTLMKKLSACYIDRGSVGHTVQYMTEELWFNSWWEYFLYP
jgi:hypothetical protein